MITCGTCKLEIVKGEIHDHMPDIFLNVSNMSYQLMRSQWVGSQITTLPLPFNLPERWADWVIETCGGSISMSGIYRLPGMVWEWCILKMAGDEDGAKFVAKRIDGYLGM